MYGRFHGGAGFFGSYSRTCVETLDPQFFSKSAEKLSSGVFWGVESKNQLRIRK